MGWFAAYLSVLIAMAKGLLFQIGAALLLLAFGLVLAQGCRTGKGEQPVSYNFDIRPLLSDKCFKCHGPDANKREAGLRLDIPEAAYAPLSQTKGAYAIVPGKPEESELIKRIRSTDPTYQMPTPESHLGAFTAQEVALFEQWIAQGARYEKHWAFEPPQKAKPPATAFDQLAVNEIDHFLFEAMAANGLQPNKPADKERLLKRVMLDITGLLPTPHQTRSFVQDTRSNAYELLIDSLLTLPQYGEKMAVHWMDVARYADSYGYQDDNLRTQWPWRDWVIRAFNDNMPYNQFITWQLAGDLLPNATPPQILATAFLRNHKYTEEGGVIDEEYRVEYLVDKVKTYSKGLLGLTVECAQCHDHKYDPVSQQEYYSLYAFFNNSREPGFEGDVSVSQPAKTPILKLSQAEVRQWLPYLNKPDTMPLQVSVMGERDTVRPTYVLSRGVYNRPAEAVTPAALPAVMRYDSVRYPPNRLGLAQWTVSPQNPLTARVWVNQLWQEVFGRGLVKTAGDFGMQGELPSHPALLDWLAADFMENGWNMKRLLKQMLMSYCYRQSAAASPGQLQSDPENIYMSRYPRQRLKAEFVRDAVLLSSGLLNPAIGGPSVKPYQPKGLWEAATSGRGLLATYRQDHGEQLYRRGLYTFIKLTVPPPAMVLFDASNRDQCEVTRLKTNTPLQALTLMNDPAVLEAARVLAQQLMAAPATPEARIATAFERILCRRAKPKELKILLELLQQQQNYYKANTAQAIALLQVGEYKQTPAPDRVAEAALMQVILALYNMEEATTKT